MTTTARGLCLILIATGLTSAQGRPQPDLRMNFFVSSVGLGHGGDLGGVRGADVHCAELAAAVGSPRREWRAYLSAPAVNPGGVAINARARIGAGPWFNFRGQQIASDLANLHSSDNQITPETALTEKGDQIPRGQLDILTGSDPNGELARSDGDVTCSGWTSSAGGRAKAGRFDYPAPAKIRSWNSSHLITGCSEYQFREHISRGLVYCFAGD